MNIPIFEIVPTSGVGQIKFGMSRYEVRSVLGIPEFSDEHRDCFLSGFQVSFDPTGLVEFIELADSDKFSTSFHGECLHRLSADEAVALVSQYGDLSGNDQEFGHSFIFPMLEMSLWRGVMPSSLDDDEGRYFEAVGIGRLGYFSGE